jgi:predicted metal-dependent phosphoesterase TrpH
MRIDLHIHTKTCSDGNLSIDEVFKEAKKRNINLMSTTDHDCIDCQERAIALAREYVIAYITGVELNVTFPYLNKSVSLDFLGYRYDIGNQELKAKLQLLKEHREIRARQILEKLNVEFDKENIPRFTKKDIKNIQAGVDGVFGRPHIANYLIEKGIVGDKQEALDRKSTRLNSSHLYQSHAHPSDPNGTSLVSITPDLDEQSGIIEKYMLDYIDGVECWHSRHDAKTTAHYVEFAKKHNLLMTGGSDCHQKPIIMGTLNIPDWVADQFQ